MGPILALLDNIGLLHALGQAGIIIEAKILAEILAAAINLIITIPLNYVINKYWAYRKEKN